MRISDWSSDVCSSDLIALGEAQSITLNPGNVTQAFRFDAGAGNRLFFDHIGGSTDPYWRLIDPRGQVVFGPSRVGDIEEPPLPLTGTYTLLVEGRIPTGAPQTLD